MTSLLAQFIAVSISRPRYLFKYPGPIASKLLEQRNLCLERRQRLAARPSPLLGPIVQGVSYRLPVIYDMDDVECK